MKQLAKSVKLGVSVILKLAPTWQVAFLVLIVAIFIAEPQRLCESVFPPVVPQSGRLIIPLTVLFLLLLFLSQTWRQRVRHLRQTVSSEAWEGGIWVTWLTSSPTVVAKNNQLVSLKRCFIVERLRSTTDERELIGIRWEIGKTN